MRAALLILCLCPACVLVTRGGSSSLHSPLVDPAPEVATRDFEDCRRILVEGAVDVEVRVGVPGSLRVEGDAGRLAEVQTEVREATLTIARVPGAVFRDGPRVVVEVPALAAAVAAGGGWVAVAGLDAERFEAEVRGGGDLLLRGRVGTLTVRGDGSGDLDLSALTCERVEGELTGRGRLRRAR